MAPDPTAGDGAVSAYGHRKTSIQKGLDKE